MAQNFRDMLSNRKFAIPLIALLGVCFIGLLLLGVVLILPGLGGTSDGDRVADAIPTEAVVEPEPTEVPNTPTLVPTKVPTPEATPSLVPVGTQLVSAADDLTATAATEQESTPEASATTEAVADEATPEGGQGDQPAAAETPAVEDQELAETGVGWGLVIFSGAGLAAVVVAARRLRMST
jgi:hypothetical protein